MISYTLYLAFKDNTTTSLEGESAHSFSGSTVNEEVLAFDGLEEGETIINFWGSWCEPCKREMPAFQDVYSTYNVNIISVNLGDTNLVVNEFINRYNLTFPVIIDKDSSIRQEYKIDRLPATFLVENGTIKKVHIGELTKEELGSWIN